MKSQNQHKSREKKPTLQDILIADCDVCFSTFEKVPPKKLDEGLQILLCSKCFIHVHKCCYDFQPSLTVISSSVSEFLCQRCKSQQLTKSQCIVCYGDNGAMKKIGEKQVIHVFCGLMHNDIEIISYYPSISFKKSIHYQQTSHICDICHRKNAHQNCAEESCKKKAHVYCAKKAYSVLSKESQQEPKCWNHKMNSGNHGVLDLSDEIIPYSLLVEQFEIVFKQLEDMNIIFEGKDIYLKKIYKQYNDELRSKRKSTKKLRRGGFSYILCPQHQTTLYCLCYGKADGEEMVLCQCCFQWYHPKCVKYAVTEDSYICQYCKVFYQFKKKAIDQIKSNRIEMDVSKVELPLKISAMDCMWVMRMIDNRIRGGMAGKMLKQLNKYPFKSSCLELLIRNQNRNKLSALADDCLKQYSQSPHFLSGLKPRVVLTCDAEGKAHVLMENVEWNKVVRKGIDVLLSLGVRVQGLNAILRELDFKDRAITDQYEQIIQLSKVEQKYQEVQILKQKAQAYNFIEIIKKINQRNTISFDELQDSIIKANSISSLPSYLTDTLNLKYTRVAPLVATLKTSIATTPNNTYVISQLIQSLRGENIQAPKEYKQLKAQNKLIQDLYLYYIKQQGHKISQQLTIQQQISILLQCQLKPNQQLLQILNNYKTYQTQYIWPNLKIIYNKINILLIQYQLKQMIKRKSIKIDKFINILNKIQEFSFKSKQEDILSLLQKWKQFKEGYDIIINRSLQSIITYQQLQQLSNNRNYINNLLITFPLKIQQDNKNTFHDKLKNKKQQIEQLKILYTQSLLNKNPLSITKIISSLPKNNPLVNQYYLLKKQQNNLISKYNNFLTKISQKLQFFKTQKKQQRKDQIRFTSQKPSISEINEFIETLKSTKIDMSKQIKQLTKIINNSLDIASKIKKYLQNKKQINNLSIDELNVRKKQIQQLRKKILIIAQLNLSNQLIQIYHMEIRLRMKIALLSPSLELDKINSLLMFAEEEHLDHDQIYIVLKENFQNKNKKYKEVNLIKNIQNQLITQANKDQSGYYIHLFNVRRTLAVPDPNQTKTKHQYLDDLIQKNKVFRQKLKKIKNKVPNKYDFNQAKNIYLQSLKNPFQIPQIFELHPQISKTHLFLKHWKQTFKYQTNVDQYIRQYDELLFTIDEIEQIKKHLKTNQQQLLKLNYYLLNYDEKYYNELQQIIEKIQNNNINININNINNNLIKDNQLCRQAQIKYLKYWIKILNQFKINKIIIPYQKIKRLLYDSYNLLQRFIRYGQNYDQLRIIINQLEDYIIMIRNHLKGHPVYHKDNCLSQEFIDLEEFYLENDHQDVDLVQLIPLLRPFNDLSKFRTKNLQKLQYRKEQSSNYKRNHSKLDDLKLQSSQKNISSKYLDQQQHQNISNTVGDNQRKKIKQILLKNIRKNQQLKKYGQYQNQIKMIQNQIFGQWHNDILKYLQTSQQFQKLFIKLINCPNISNKLIKKKFQFKFIQILITNLNKIQELQSMLNNKAKQLQNQKTINKITESIIAEKSNNNSISNNNNMDNQQQNIMNSIATGKIDEQLRLQIKKQMKLLKESKHKKKKHHKHRSRSKSPQAKFSSESQEKLPTHIEEQYYKNQIQNNDKNIEINAIKMNQSPLRYDPQEQQLSKNEVIYPKGSILKLKNCDLQINSKKKGRIIFPVEILTEQQHKKLITELIDPGFSRLPIRKDKNESQIIQYINKSKKKYKYLICWFQAINPDDNEWLKQMSIDVNQKKKIYGWQNQHIKVHIMSIKQLVQINRFNAPSRVSSNAAFNYLNHQRIAMIIQYPQRIYEIKDLYKPFSQIQRKNQEFKVAVPEPIVQPNYNIFYPNYNIPTIQPTVKPIFTEQQKLIYEGGWGSDTTNIPINQPTIVPIMQSHVQPPAQPHIIPPINSSIPFRVSQIRMHFGFGNYSPIMSDQQDAANDDKNKEDLAGNLLNQLGDFGKKSNNLMPPATNANRDAMHYQQHQQIQHSHSQQPYQNYYQNYPYQPQPQGQPMRSANQSRWVGYQNHNQGISQPFPQNSLQSYNPINPMTGKYTAAHLAPQIQNPLYKNPMMNNQRNGPPNIQNPQFYRPPYGNNEDYSRYQGGYQQ